VNDAYIRIMKHIWQSTFWPKFDYDRKAAEPHL